MKVRMLTSVAGTRNNGSVYCHEAGEVYDLSNEVAKDYLSRPEGMPRAEPVAEPPSGRRQTGGRETR